VWTSSRRTAACPTRKTAESRVGGRVSLALVIHNHQPVGNFGWVIEDVYERAYSPLLGALERHPGIRLALHYSGRCCSGWRPIGRRRSRRSAAWWIEARSRWSAAASTKPILVTLPDRDRHGQLVRMGDEIEAIFGGDRPGRGWPSVSGSRLWRTTWPRRATAGPCSTTITSGRPRSAKTTCGPPSRPTTAAGD